MRVRIRIRSRGRRLPERSQVAGCLRLASRNARVVPARSTQPTHRWLLRIRGAKRQSTRPPTPRAKT
eukprot:2474205-Lingulodinium_polyedra.AAC.1